MVKGVKKLKFPKPGATKEKEQVTMINAERMLIHYNQDHPSLKSPAKRVTEKIIVHTVQKALEANWAGAAVVKDAISGHTAGMMLLRAKKTTIAPDVLEGKVVPPAARKALR